LAATARRLGLVKHETHPLRGSIAYVGSRFCSFGISKLELVSLNVTSWNRVIPPGGAPEAAGDRYGKRRWTADDLAFCAAILQYATAALMLFPFVPNDGYYMLTVMFDMHDLGRSARRLLRLVLRGPRWQRDGEISICGPARTAAFLAFAAGSWLAHATVFCTLIWIVLQRLGR
jgi:hypothetical protein